ncbi:hypothetical protein OIU78_029679 [Salix suchowensis]|nr:hypothetical protein OIU78_029679 [Salix suchowensis]
MDGSSSGGGNGHRVEAERWLSISKKLLSAPTIAVHSSKYGQQECFGIFLQLRDQVLPPNLDIYCAFFCDPASNMGSREVSLVMEGSLIRSAIGYHWDFNKFLAFSWYTCTHHSTFTASKY